MIDEYLSIKQFAALIGIHVNTVRRLIKKGRLIAVSMGTEKKAHYRIARSELNRIAVIDLNVYIEKIVDDRLKGKE